MGTSGVDGSRAEARFEIEYRIKAMFFLFTWISWRKDDYALESGIWQWIAFWQREANADRAELRGYEWVRFQEWRKGQNGKGEAL